MDRDALERAAERAIRRRDIGEALTILEVRAQAGPDGARWRHAALDLAEEALGPADPHTRAAAERLLAADREIPGAGWPAPRPPRAGTPTTRRRCGRRSPTSGPPCRATACGPSDAGCRRAQPSCSGRHPRGLGPPPRHPTRSGRRPPTGRSAGLARGGRSMVPSSPSSDGCSRPDPRPLRGRRRARSPWPCRRPGPTTPGRSRPAPSRASCSRGTGGPCSSTPSRWSRRRSPRRTSRSCGGPPRTCATSRSPSRPPSSMRPPPTPRGPPRDAASARMSARCSRAAAAGVVGVAPAVARQAASLPGGPPRTETDRLIALLQLLDPERGAQALAGTPTGLSLAEALLSGALLDG